MRRTSREEEGRDRGDAAEAKGRSKVGRGDGPCSPPLALRENPPPTPGSRASSFENLRNSELFHKPPSVYSFVAAALAN